MKSLFKRVAVGALAAAMLLSTGLTAMARDVMTDMEFVSYHVEANEAKLFGVEVGAIYNEIRDGRLTGKQVVVEHPNTNKVLGDLTKLEWRFEGYDAAYPYVGYECLYIVNAETNEDIYKFTEVIRYNGQTPQWATKRQDFSWDITRPYEIYERQMTKVNGTTWTWDFGNARFGIDDEVVCKPSGRYVVEPAKEDKNEIEAWEAEWAKIESWETIGTACFALDGTMIFNTDPNTMEYKMNSEIADLYDKFGDIAALRDFAIAEIGEATETNPQGEADAEADDLDWASLSERDAVTNQYVIDDEDIQKMIPVFKKKFVTAPGERSRDVLATYLANPEYPVWDTAAADDTIEVFYDATISWTIPQFEINEPYREFQYLKVNGVALDGTKDANGNVKPVVGRYTGSLANPKVEWVFHKYGKRVDFAGDMVDRDVYEVIECKVLDGKHVVDIFGNHVTRVQTDVYGYGYYKAIPGGVQYRIAMGDGSNDIGYDEYISFTGEVETATNEYLFEQGRGLDGVHLWIK